MGGIAVVAAAAGRDDAAVDGCGSAAAAVVVGAIGAAVGLPRAGAHVPLVPPTGLRVGSAATTVAVHSLSALVVPGSSYCCCERRYQALWETVRK